MSATGLDVFDKSIHETNAFVKIVMRDLETDDRHMAFGALRGALHALRDNLGVGEIAHLSDQLPMLLRGLFYEGWTPASNPPHERHLPDFLAHVARQLPPRFEKSPEAAAHATFAALSERMEPRELNKLVEHLPHELRALWPVPASAAN